MFQVNFNSIYTPGKLVGYNILYNTKNKRQQLIQKIFIAIHTTMAVLSAAKGAHWVISRKAIQTGISGIEIVFRHECRTSTPVFNLITLYRHQSQFFRINKYTESYYDNLPTAQKTKFAVVYWLMLLLDIAIVASELLFFFVWNRLADTDYELAFYILDVISISYSTLWYVIPMSQYFLCVYILTYLCVYILTLCLDILTYLCTDHVLYFSFCQSSPSTF
uniref:Uncharacterized protein n=2 Tax=Cacopsylla melanoneura TaxID=428564 RepID=A0A8D8WQQ0_9HEMI